MLVFVTPSCQEMNTLQTLQVYVSDTVHAYMQATRLQEVLALRAQVTWRSKESVSGQ